MGRCVNCLYWDEDDVIDGRAPCDIWVINDEGEMFAAERAELLPFDTICLYPPPQFGCPEFEPRDADMPDDDEDDYRMVQSA